MKYTRKIYTYIYIYKKKLIINNKQNKFVKVLLFTYLCIEKNVIMGKQKCSWLKWKPV